MPKLSKKQFAEQMSALLAIIKAKQAEAELLRHQYFDEKCPFRIGEKVWILHPKIKEPMAIGYVRWISLMDDGTFHYLCHRADRYGRQLQSKYHYPEDVSYQEHILIGKYEEED